MKKIIIAMDSFKGSGTSSQVAFWVAQGIRRVNQQLEIQEIPIADGGEGTVAALVQGMHGQFQEAVVTGPLGKKVTARYGLLPNQQAVIEMAEASGLALINPQSDDVFQASTYGVGELMLAAIEAGAKTIYLGLGGSGTNDGGVGMAQALGVSFKDAVGNEILPGAKGLESLAQIDSSGLHPAIEKTTIKILADVANPLTGANGATAVYGPQKGLQKDDIAKVDHWLESYGQLIFQTTGLKVVDIPGSGAAGGLGAGLLAFAGAKVIQGITEILDLLNFEEAIRDAAFVITGEGRLDSQSLEGKAPLGVARLAKKFQLPVVAIVGSYQGDISGVYPMGIDLVIAAIHRPQTLIEALDSVSENLAAAGETAIRSYLFSDIQRDS
ncbi:glycerate kinase [Enterococcus sp. HY326]|uniref:glycerate kinase n=1 Tax=Enterococcus sp. HY326 TaxID=2971265 RepID=UPI00223F680B|nr:glycerate kinase [Enterococcus sp. HY326]